MLGIARHRADTCRSGETTYRFGLRDFLLALVSGRANSRGCLGLCHAIATGGRTLLLPKQTISGHHEVMKQVRIAELKSHLSEYLRAVRGGQTIAVLDRETPVAHIVPVRDRASLKIRKPQSGSPPVNRVPLPRPLKIKLDVVELLLEERQLHR